MIVFYIQPLFEIIFFVRPSGRTRRTILVLDRFSSPSSISLVMGSLPTARRRDGWMMEWASMALSSPSRGIMLLFSSLLLWLFHSASVIPISYSLSDDRYLILSYIIVIKLVNSMNAWLSIHPFIHRLQRQPVQ